MKSSAPVRAFGIALALPQAVIGLWASVSPRGWFDSFPGLGPALGSLALVVLTTHRKAIAWAS